MLHRIISPKTTRELATDIDLNVSYLLQRQGVLAPLIVLRPDPHQVSAVLSFIQVRSGSSPVHLADKPQLFHHGFPVHAIRNTCIDVQGHLPALSRILNARFVDGYMAFTALVTLKNEALQVLGTVVALDRRGKSLQVEIVSSSL